MPNSRDFDWLVCNRFHVVIDGIEEASFTSFEGIDAKTDVIIFNNDNDIRTRKRPGRTTYANLVLKRGYTSSDKLWKWYNDVTRGICPRRTMSVIALDDTGDEILRYNFYEAWPCRWKGMKFDASINGALFEEIEIAVEWVERG